MPTRRAPAADLGSPCWSGFCFCCRATATPYVKCAFGGSRRLQSINRIWPTAMHTILPAIATAQFRDRDGSRIAAHRVRSETNFRLRPPSNRGRADRRVRHARQARAAFHLSTCSICLRRDARPGRSSDFHRRLDARRERRGTMTRAIRAARSRGNGEASSAEAGLLRGSVFRSQKAASG